MNFDFSDDQKLLADQVRRYLDDHCPNSVARAVLDGEQAYAPKVWQGLAEMGLIGTAIDEAYAGTGAGYLELCLVAREIGAHIAPVPFGTTVYQFAEALQNYGSEAQREQWLASVARGETIGTLAIVESLGVDIPATPQCEVSDGKLSGTKLAVTDGALADAFVVLAQENGSAGLYVVAAGEGVSSTTVQSVDLTKNVANVTFRQAPAQALVGADHDALSMLEDRAAVLYAFEQLGGAQSALDMAVAYAQERFAFGRAIGSFQAIKHMLADMYVSLKLAESNCYYAAWALENDAQDLSLAAATARVAATQAFQLCARDNVQVHGGMGFTWEFDCHMYYRRANLLALELGGLSKWERRLVNNLPLQASA